MTHGLFEAAKSWSLGPVKRLKLNAHALLKEQGGYDLFCDASEKHSVEKEYNAMFRLQCGEDVYFVGPKCSYGTGSEDHFLQS